jgi:hypothetical protein
MQIKTAAHAAVFILMDRCSWNGAFDPKRNSECSDSVPESGHSLLAVTQGAKWREFVSRHF